MSDPHRVLVGINYTPSGKKDEVRAEKGDVVDDLTQKDARTLRQMGAIAREDGSDAADEPEPEVDVVSPSDDGNGAENGSDGDDEDGDD